MKLGCAIVAALGLVSASAALSQSLPQEKLNELAREGRASWTPGQERGNGPVSAALASPIDTNKRGAAKDTATMTYDDGVISSLPTVFGQMYGNRFSQGVSGVPLNTMTLNSFSFYFAEDSTADTGLFFQPADPSTMAGMIVSRASLDIAPLVNAGPSFSNLTTINVIPQTALGTTGVFNNTMFLGAWSLNANTTVPVDNEAIGLSNNANFQRGYTASSGGAGASVAFAAQPFNAVLRANVTSASTVPVELMQMEVE